MTLTHWFLLCGGMTIIAITIDGIRRMISRPSTLAINLDETLQNLPVSDFRAELPNGGARLAEHSVAKEVADTPKPIEEVGSVAEAAELETEQFEPCSITDVDAEAPVLDELDIAAEVSEEPELESFASDMESVAVDEEHGAVEAALMDDETVSEIAMESSATLDQELELAEPFAPEFDLASPEDSQQELASEEQENPLMAVFDPTRPVHEVVESHKMVQGDMFAEQQEEAPVEALDDWSEYSDLEGANEPVTNAAELEDALEDDPLVAAENALEAEIAVECIAETAEQLGEQDFELEQLEADSALSAAPENDDILLTDTGLDEVENKAESIGARLAKVTSFSFGKKLLENRRKQAEEAQTLQELVESEESVVVNVEQVLSIIVAAKDPQGFFGNNLHGLVEACGMVHGSMDLFHRFEDGLTEGQTQFSLANMTDSGAFDLDTIANIHTAGVVFFLTLPSANDSIRAFDYMLETAQCLANNLGGELYDENRSVLRAQTVEHYRQRIREFERQRLARRAHGV